MVKRTHLRTAAVVIGCAAVLSTPAPAGASDAPATSDQRNTTTQAAVQQCHFRVLKTTKIQLDSGDIAYQQPGDLVQGQNPRGEAPVWVWSYRHVERGWIYRTYDNMSIIECWEG
ncbi:hypothetical protein HDA32_003143 [Spinactinospora alkalitolerans]|uniref:SH3 domain-containing protein n=1 Tax=Spinactinospora alkalitolerans TaxID=687207 RepID=A0A852TZ05_9ACTN|nr:hypothetical protein [Spinactinospora alkalitolerans]NYE48023.1 hypothetical protein [Spinactinospora alkalitolerans]